MKIKTFSKQYYRLFTIPNLSGNEYLILNILISMDESETIKDIFVSDKSISDSIFNRFKINTVNKIIKRLHQKNIITAYQAFNEGRGGSVRIIIINEDVYKILDGEDITIQPRTKLTDEDYKTVNDILTGKKEVVTTPIEVSDTTEHIEEDNSIDDTLELSKEVLEQIKVDDNHESLYDLVEPEYLEHVIDIRNICDSTFNNDKAWEILEEVIGSNIITDPKEVKPLFQNYNLRVEMLENQGFDPKVYDSMVGKAIDMVNELIN